MLSIIIPTLNEEKYLPLLLESIKKQDFLDYEVIVADAGSTDGTGEIARRCGCRVIKGGAVAVGRNNGAAAARGGRLLFIDADLIFPHDKFLTNVLREISQKNIGVAGFALTPIGGNAIDNMALSFWNVLSVATQSFMPNAAAVIFSQKKIHEGIGGFDASIKLAEDHEYVRLAGKKEKFGFIFDEPVLFSTRRFAKEGSIKTYGKYLLAGLYMIFIGPIKSDIFKYKFNHYDETKK